MRTWKRRKNCNKLHHFFKSAHNEDKEDDNSIASSGGFCIDQWTIPVQAGEVFIHFKLGIGVRGSMVPETRILPMSAMPGTRILPMSAMSSTQELTDDKKEEWCET